MILHWIMQNGIVSGGLALMAGGSLIASLRWIPHQVYTWLRGLFVYTMEIESADSAFDWLRVWLTEKSSASFVSAGVSPEGGRTFDQSSTENPRFFFYPRTTSAIRYRGRRLIIWSSKESVQGAMHGIRETLTVQALFGTRALFESLLHEAHQLASRRDGKTLEIWVPDGSSWRLLDRKPVRSRESLVLADGIWESVVEDAARFIEGRAWYETRGIPYHRTYLFEGPPGSGKSSLAHGMASALKMNVSTASLGSIYSDETLLGLLSRVPTSHVLLLEDIDATGIKRDGGCLTLSALLNILDGAASKEGRIVVMTSNFPEKLDAALIRPGRVDVRIHIDNATAKQAEGMFRRFFPTGDPGDFGAEWAGKSMASIQEHLLQAAHSGPEEPVPPPAPPVDMIDKGMGCRRSMVLSGA